MDLQKVKRMLEERRRHLAQELSQIEHALDAPMPKDWEDRSSERQDDEVLEALGHVETAELKRVDAALQRILNGTYGICAKCEEPISGTRLIAVPDAALSKTCAR